MNKFLKQHTFPIVILIIVFGVLTSCIQDAENQAINPDLPLEYDQELKLVLDLIDDDPTGAITKLDEIISNAESAGSIYYSGKAKWYQGYIYDEIIQDVSKAYYSYNEALKDILQTDDSDLKMKIYNNLGLLYRFYGQYDAAIRNYEAALELESDLTRKQLSDLYYNYGVPLKLKGDSVSFFLAEEAFTKSLEYAKGIEDHENIASVYNQIGLMYKAIGDYEMARISYDNTIRTYSDNPDMQSYIGKAYHGIGITYRDEGNLDASIQAFKKALQYKKKSGSIFITKYDMGTVLMDNGQKEEAITVWKDALNEKHDKNSIEQVKIYSDLSQVLKANNKYEEALAFSEIYNSSIQAILEEGERYKIQNDQVLFADIVKEYEEFNAPVPLYSKPWFIATVSLSAMVLIYLAMMIYYRVRATRKVSEAVSRIQTEFQHIKVE